MENKMKFIKIFISMAIILVVIIAMYVYITTNEIIEKQKEVLEKDNKISNLTNENLNEVHDEVANEIYNTINDNFVDEEIEESKVVPIDFEANLINNEKNLSNEEFEEIARNLLIEYMKIINYENSTIGPMPDIVCYLGLMKEQELRNEMNLINNMTLSITSSINYEEFKNSLLKLVTEDYFINHFSQYRNIDGKLEFCDYAGGGILYSVDKVKLISTENGIYKFDVTLRDEEVYSHYLSGEENITKDDYEIKVNVDFKIIDNRMVISKYIYNINLDGYFPMPASDVAFDFYKDGKVEYSTNNAIFVGEFELIDNEKINIIWNKKIYWDENGNKLEAPLEGNRELIVLNNNVVAERYDDERKNNFC